PPTASMDGIDLITEGVLTLSMALAKIKVYAKPIENLFGDEMAFGNDGASLLAKMLICECSHLNLWVGKAINPAHQNPDFPLDLSIKLNKILELKEILEGLGKKVTLNFV
ncbi:MAG TPA: serine/threonine-protein phosphatase, partial [Clostridiaceae bacterium]|nr:serine/threonine-protein phosphatase [Clostridiaceae bacterium]